MCEGRCGCELPCVKKGKKKKRKKKKKKKEEKKKENVGAAACDRETKLTATPEECKDHQGNSKICRHMLRACMPSYQSSETCTTTNDQKYMPLNP